MTTLKQVRNLTIQEHLTKVEKARQALIDAVIDIQRNCSHLNVGEGPHHSGQTTRVCIDCGLSERGYRFDFLTNKLVFKLDDKDVLSYEIGFNLDQNTKGLAQYRAGSVKKFVADNLDNVELHFPYQL